MEGLKTTQINETPLQPNDLGNLEIMSGYDETRVLTRCRKCRIVCGREQTGVLVVAAGVGGSNFYIFYAYDGGFNREGLWVFFALGVLSSLLVLSFLIRTWVAIQNQGKEKKAPKIAAAVKGVVA
eukprot:Stramenopile-MAST_4_protein_6314